MVNIHSFICGTNISVILLPSLLLTHNIHNLHSRLLSGKCKHRLFQVFKQPTWKREIKKAKVYCQCLYNNSVWSQCKMKNIKMTISVRVSLKSRLARTVWFITSISSLMKWGVIGLKKKGSWPLLSVMGSLCNSSGSLKCAICCITHGQASFGLFISIGCESLFPCDVKGK